jgi:hypothetical protein
VYSIVPECDQAERLLWHKGGAFRRCGEYVRYVRSYCRVDNPARMPPRVTRIVASRGASEDGGHKRQREVISGPPSSRNRPPTVAGLSSARTTCRGLSVWRHNKILRRSSGSAEPLVCSVGRLTMS